MSPAMVSDLRARLDRHLADLAAARARVRAEKEGLAAARARAGHLREAQALAQAIAQQVQAQAHHRIADVVSRSLAAVFEEPYVFQIKFEQRRGRTEAVLVFERNGLEVDPMTASGGGVVDVAAFALRLSALLLHRPPLRRLLVLDEPFRFVSAEYLPRVAALLQALAHELKVQIVMVTHSEALACGSVVRI